jgi:hypothetical protein
MNSKISSIAARLAIGFIIAYQLILILLIFIRPDLDPSWHTISEWAIGRHGWVMSMAFIISALSYAALWILLKSQVRGLTGNIGTALLFICVIGTIGVAVFTTDPYPPDFTITKTLLHTICGGSAMFLLPFAALLININLALKNNAWLPARNILLWTAVLPLLALIGFILHLSIFVMPLGENANGPGVQIGWPPRILFFTYMIWVVTLALQAIKLQKLKSNDGI